MQSTTPDTIVRFIADDFGRSEAINHAILKAHVDGALHGACLMMGQPGTQQAVAMARASPSLAIGWHVHLCDSQPVVTDSWSWGSSPFRAGLAMAVSPGARKLAAREIGAQWRLFKDTGLMAETVNAHHHLHWHPFVRRQLIELLTDDAEFDGWMRWGTPRFFSGDSAPLGYRLIDSLLQAPVRSRLGLRCSDTLWGIDRTFRMNAEEIRDVIGRLPGGLHEFMFHPRPGIDDPDTRCLISLSHEARA